MFFSRKKKNKEMFEGLADAVNWVKAGLAYSIIAKNRTDLGDEQANYLAAVVSNEVFGDVHGNERAINYMRENKELVENEIRRIGQDERVSSIVLQTIDVRGLILSQTTGEVEYKICAITKLQRYDWTCDAKTQIAESSLEIFYKDAFEFMKKQDEIMKS